jgi:hypothetical protein
MEELVTQAYRTTDETSIEKWIEQSYTENPINTFIIALYTRDCRQGKGERKVGLRMLKILFKRDPERFYKIAELIPTFGRWDDLIKIMKNGSELMRVITTQLFQDINDMDSNRKISLLAKWLPTENCKLDKKHNFITSFCDYTFLSKREYRKTISSLRKYLKITERLMCEKKWGEIEYSKVPSKCMLKLSKAFQKNDPERFSEFKRKLTTGETKICGKTLFPHELVMQICRLSEEDITLEKQWETILQETCITGTLENSICICDVSGSMGDISHNKFVPIHASIGLSILISQCAKGDFREKIITFSSEPEFVDLSLWNTVREKIYNLSRANWQQNTNLQKVFELILNVAKNGAPNGIPNEFLPKKLFIFSDMEFDCAVSNNSSLDEIKRKYQESGYTLPTIIFWNLSGNIRHSPCEPNENGVIMISGFSPVILKILMKNGFFSTKLFIQSIIESPRYLPIIDVLAN